MTAAAASVRAVASSSTHDNGRSPPVSIPPAAGCMRGERGDYSGGGGGGGQLEIRARPVFTRLKLYYDLGLVYPENYPAIVILIMYSI